jgi:hypothetical protein
LAYITVYYITNLNCYIQRYKKYLTNPNMPIPNPSNAETQNDYVGRCMSEISGEYPQEQALAICISTYQKETMSKDKQQRVADKMSGIALLQGLDEACWEGYEAIGTKILNGKEVPNCVPIKD